MSYASGTTVSVDRSIAEIQSTLRRYGAEGFMYGEEGRQALLAFKMAGRQVRFVVELPPVSEFELTEAGRARRGDAARKAWDQEIRRRWRALALVVKAKLEAVASGMVIFEDEFLAYIVTPDGKTVGEHVRPRIAEAYESGQMPRALLPAHGSKS